MPKGSFTETLNLPTYLSQSEATRRFWTSDWQKWLQLLESRKASAPPPCQQPCRKTYLPAPEQLLEQSPICRRNKYAERNWMGAPICFPSVWCSMRWRQALFPFAERHPE